MVAVATATTLRLNGFRLEPSTESFTAYRASMPAGGDLRELRQSFAGSWTLYREDDLILGVPLSDPPTAPFGEAEEIRCENHLGFLAYLIDAALPRAISSYPVFKQRPFTFLGKKQEIVEAAVRSTGAIGRSPLVASFVERAKYKLEARLVELRDGDPFIGLFVDVGTRREITASLADLDAAGITLAGLDVVWRDPPPETRRLVGRIGRLNGDRVELSEVLEGPCEVDAGELTLEASPVAFKRCLSVLLGDKYASFESARRVQQDRLMNGPAREGLIEEMERFLAKASPLELAPGLSCEIGERVALENASDYQSVVGTRPVQYCFDASKSRRHVYAWQGIERFGPFSRETFAKKSPRLLVVFPDTCRATWSRSCAPSAMAFASATGDKRSPPGSPARSASSTLSSCWRRFPGCSRARGSRSSSTARRSNRRSSASRVLDAALLVILDKHAQLADVDSPYLHAKALLLTNAARRKSCARQRGEARFERGGAEPLLPSAA